MMRRMLAMLVLALTAGCATVVYTPFENGPRTVDGETALGMVEVDNVCWDFLFLPIASGDVDNPNGWTCDWFSRSTTLDNQLTMLEREARRLGARKAIDVVTLSDDEDVLLILFLREKIRTSAVLLK